VIPDRSERAVIKSSIGMLFVLMKLAANVHALAEQMQARCRALSHPPNVPPSFDINCRKSQRQFCARAETRGARLNLQPSDESNLPSGGISLTALSSQRVNIKIPNNVNGR